ncbi:MAG TPA: hypothetical protein VIC26_14770 [Marinagarivorans sp.]
MRLSTLYMLLATSLVAACGSDNDNDSANSSSSAMNLPDIVQEDANTVTVPDGEFYRPTTFVDDAAYNRWLIADKAQGIIAVDKTSGAKSRFLPFGEQDGDIKSARDIALDSTTNTLYVLDTRAAQIAAIDTQSKAVTIVATDEDFDALDDAGWAAPTSLFYDNLSQRLLIGDRTGLLVFNDNSVQVTTFCIFTYTPNTGAIDILSEASNRANPLLRSDVRDFYYDADNNRIITTGLNYSSSGTPYYGGLIIPVDDWGAAELYYRDPIPATSTSVSHSVTYNEDTSAAYVVNDDVNAIFAFNLDLFTETDEGTLRPPRVFITYGGDGGAYPFSRPLALAYSTDEGLLMLDESSRALLAVADVEIPTERPEQEEEQQDNAEDNANEDSSASDDSTDESLIDEEEASLQSAERRLLTSGTPLSATSDTFIRTPFSLLAAPASDTLLITDASNAQRNTLQYNDGAYSIWPFSVNLDAINAIEVKFSTTTQGSEPEPLDPPPAPTITEPKPIIFSKNANGDLYTFALGFRRATDDDYVMEQYLSGVYRRLSGETQFTPFSTAEFTLSDNTKEPRLKDFSAAFTPSEVRNIAVVDEGIFYVLQKTTSSSSRSYIYFWNKNNDRLYIVNDSTGAYSPRNITGSALSRDQATLYFVDSDHDALIAVSLSELTSTTPTFEFRVASGRQTTGEAYLYLPAGLAIDDAESTAWVFENSARALVQIDLASGSRTRIDSAINYIESAGTMALSDDESRLFITDKTTNRIIQLTLADAEQTLLDP